VSVEGGNSMEEKENTLAYEILQDMKRQNKRIFILAMIVISLLFIYIGYDRYKDSINDNGIEAQQQITNSEN
jgi:hypothetical protein